MGDFKRCTGNCELCGKCNGEKLLMEMRKRKSAMTFMPEDFDYKGEADGYGVAFDIGTTTVVGLLWNLKDGELLANDARRNPQVIHGGDVISRINFSNQDYPANLEKLQSLIVSSMNETIEGFCKNMDLDIADIKFITAVGNTTMSHLLLGKNPKSLAEAPFAPAFTGEVIIDANEIGINLPAGVKLYVMPNIAGHVGSDITAGILALKLRDMQGRNIFVDIGTNGEITFANNGKLSVCSTAAGPAFEGATIYQGMRATMGAIEAVSILDGDLELKVIPGSKDVMGICGSGLIDAVAVCLNEKLIDKKGRIITKEDALKNGINEKLANRLIENEDGRAIILAERNGKEPIVLKQNDIREVQLAKSAIYSGIMTLLALQGLKEEDIDNVFLAGAFGNYIRKEAAVRIGLLPNISIEKIKAMGNSAGVGSSMALLSKEGRKLADLIAKETDHVELADTDVFFNFYVANMHFNLLA